MNDAERLYFAVDDPEDVLLDDWDNFSIFLDTNHDRLWPAENSEEGLLRCYWDETLGQANSTFAGISGNWQDNISVTEPVWIFMLYRCRHLRLIS